MKVRVRFLVLASLMLAPVGARAQVLNMGTEFPVNAFTTGRQEHPALAAFPDGGFVVVWGSEGQDGDSFGVFGQRFNSVGTKVGSEFQVNAYTTGGQGGAAVAADGQGNFVVVWASDLQVGIIGQRYDAAGTKVGGEFSVSTTTGNGHRLPAIAMTADGRFVVVWEGAHVYGQRFDAAGAKAGGEFQINQYPFYNHAVAGVATDAAGRFVVVWTSSGDGDSDAVSGQRFDASGGKVGPEFRVNTYTTGSQAYPRIAMKRAGTFVVAWDSVPGDGDSTGVFAQRFNANAEKVGPEFQVNEYTTAEQRTGSVAFEADGGFDIAWRSFGEDGDGFAVEGQQFDRTGTRRGFGIGLGSFVGGNQIDPRIAYSSAGLVGVWEGVDEDETGIRGGRQRFQPVALAADIHGEGNSDLNGVIEPGEAVRVETTWRNRAPGLVNMDGTVLAAGFEGPPGPTYTLLDGFTEFPTIFSGGSSTCGADPSPCYAVQVGGARPFPHWDATLTENLSLGGQQIWTLHIGESFPDVPRSQPFYKKIETLLHHGITTGCDTTHYCPGTVVSRDAMAIFIAKGIAGSGEYVPSSGNVGAAAYSCKSSGHSLFTDVAPTASFCKHVHYLASQNVTLGCNATQYCPSQTITRDAMASFIAKAIIAPGGGNAVPASYTDATTARSYSCVSGSANLHFSDVSVSNAFCKHIHYLWAKGIVDGCTATKYCPGSPVARDAMAKFIANGFGLQLYGP
jgi:hypothetical protein